MVLHSSKVRYAYWVGYQLSLEDFMHLVAGLAEMDDDETDEDYFSAYLRWRRNLPKKQQKHSLRALREIDDETATHVVFFTRFVDYKGRKQVEDPAHPDYSVIHEERPQDREKLERFVELVKQCGAEPDISKFEFTYLKELHPTTEWRNVSIPPFSSMSSTLTQLLQY
ncbi:hypothetical protein BC835DRAFT_1413490 [Cytidiella melzeri]|nr:hypothetical protein BC835DRAFT_1413490 [Cytidiella melzeri]